MRGRKILNYSDDVIQNFKERELEKEHKKEMDDYMKGIESLYDDVCDGYPSYNYGADTYDLDDWYESVCFG